MLTRPRHIPARAHKTTPYPRTCSQDHAISPHLLTRPRHIPAPAYKTTPYPRTCSQDHAISPHVLTRPRHISAPPHKTTPYPRTYSQDHAKFPCPNLNKSISTPPHCYLEVRRFARFDPSAPEQLKSSVFWVVTQCLLEGGCHVTANHTLCRIPEGPMPQGQF